MGRTHLILQGTLFIDGSLPLYLKLKIQLHVHQCFSQCKYYKVALSNDYLTVSVTVPPVLSVPRLEYTAVLGQPVSLDCTADGQPKPEVTWHRERRPVVEGTHLRLFSNGTLHITATQRSDAGIYTCSARNNVGRASHDIRLILQSEFHTIPRESLFVKSLYHMRVMRGFPPFFCRIGLAH